MIDASARIRGVIQSHCSFAHCHAIEAESDLRKDLRADDLDLMCICIALEEEFGVVISDAEFQIVETVADIERILAAKVGARA